MSKVIFFISCTSGSVQKQVSTIKIANGEILITAVNTIGDSCSTKCTVEAMENLIAQYKAKQCKESREALG